MLRYTLGVIALFLFVASILSVLGYQMPHAQTAQAKGEAIASSSGIDSHCIVRVVYDGDTLGCDFNGNGRVDGKGEQVRMLGIDSTEMHYSRKNKLGKDEPYALEAKTRVEGQTLRRRIYLEYDLQTHDKYGRRLAFVYLDRQHRQMLNTQLLREGLARVLFIGVNRRYEGEFEADELQAQQQRLRIWH